MRLLKLLLLLFVCAAGPAIAGPSEDGNAAYTKGDYTTALRLWLPLANQGDAQAQTRVGYMNVVGRGVPQNYTAAMSWFRKAADQGYAIAQSSLGRMYSSGLGVPRDLAMAAFWYRKAADQGDAAAQKSLQSVLAEMPSVASASPQHSAPGASIQMKKEGGTYVVPVLINNAITLDFTVDSGAADVTIPEDVVPR